jgi:FkbM family methyltransferase
MSYGLGYKITILGLLPRSLQRKILQSRYNQEIKISGEYELKILPSIVKSDDVALDIGANLGVYSYLLSKLCVRTIGFEPNVRLASMLTNLQLPNLEIVNAAVSSSVGTAELMVPKSRSGHVLASLHPRLKSDIGRGVEVFTVKTVTIDSLNLETVNFIKIDVEGFEEDVIRGAECVLSTSRPIVLCEIEERHNPGGLERISKFMSELGYTGYFFKQNRMCDIKEFSAKEHQNYYESHAKNKKNRSEIEYINNFLFVHQSRDIEKIRDDIRINLFSD